MPSPLQLGGQLGDLIRRPGEPRLPGIHTPGLDFPPDADYPPRLGEGDPQPQGGQPQQALGMPMRGRPPVGGLNPDFAHRFVQLQHAVRQAGGDLYVFSGARDAKHQQQLFQEAVAKYGDPRIAMKHVKPPGKSSHDPTYGAARGLGLGSLGVDIRGDLAIAHKLAPQFGIEFPNHTHPWHMEMAGVSKLKA